MPTPRSPEDIFTSELKEIYSAERQLTRLIPRLSKRVQNQRLKQCLDTRRQQGERLIEEIDQAFDEMDVAKGRPKNVAAEGLLDDINQHMEEIQDERLLEPVLIAGLQKLEHYCIAAWGTARSMGRLLGEERVIQSMERVLKEGRELDDELTRLAEDEVNPTMLQEGAGGPPRAPRTRRPSGEGAARH
jgi:ferritin-like metal-binding protein YciE